MGRGLESAAAFFGIPAETLPDVPKITITGGSVNVENHRGVKVFSEELIEIGCGRRTIRLRGSGFELRSISESEIRIGGRLLCVELD